ncbi:glycosyltransferase family 2 protein [Candidatus Omnitrophota bacterium]
MINGKKVVVVMPAYNAERTLRKTFEAIPQDIVDQVILTDDGSLDNTAIISEKLQIKTYRHDKNKGYGANQKTCYRQALNSGAEIIIMLHPDYQYDPRLISVMSRLVAEGVYDLVLGSRILVDGALKGGMPLYKYIANRVLTFIENLMIGQKLSEYHTGYRAFSKQLLETLPILENSDDFVFDNQFLLQAFYFGFKIGEISCPTCYDRDSSSIGPLRSLKYGCEVLLTGLRYLIAKSGLPQVAIFNKNGRKLNTPLQK